MEKGEKERGARRSGPEGASAHPYATQPTRTPPADPRRSGRQIRKLEGVEHGGVLFEHLLHELFSVLHKLC